MDRCLRRPVLWVAGPAGSGKTALVGSYLAAARRRVLWYRVDARDADPASFFHDLQAAADGCAGRNRKRPARLVSEHLLDPAAGPQRVFEDLYGSLAPGSCLVFDNMQAVPAESAFHDVLAGGLAHLPRGMNAVLVSRGNPTPAFAPLRVSNPGGLLGWKDLRLTHAETEAIAKRRWGKRARPGSIRYLHTRSDGWAAGLALLLEKTAVDVEPRRLSQYPPEEIFEYFGSEVFGRLDEDTRSFLMVTAFLPDVTATAARALSGSPKAEHVLADLDRRGCFTEKAMGAEPVYRYHPLFREFLLHRAERTLARDALSSIRRRTAAILEETGRIEEAGTLFREAADWEGLGRIVRDHEHRLSRQGRGCLLGERPPPSPPKNVPEDDPWHLYWKGVCHLPHETAAGRLCFERAFEMFEARGDLEGALSAWTGAVDSVLHEWNDFHPLDRWIDWLNGRLAEGFSFPSPQIEARVAIGMATAMMFRRPRMSEVGRWVERALAASRDAGDEGLKFRTRVYAALCHVLAGRNGQAAVIEGECRRLAERVKPSPVLFISWKCLEAMLGYCGAADGDVARTSLAEGLKEVRRSGLRSYGHLLHGFSAMGCLIRGDLEGASRSLGKMESTLLPARFYAHSLYHYLCAWHRLLRGDLALAAAHAEEAVKRAADSGMIVHETLCLLAAAHIEMERGNGGLADTRMSEAGRLIEGTGSPSFAFMGHLAEARLALDRGDEEAALTALRAGMALGREQKFPNMFWWWQPAVMVRLCGKSLAAGIEPDYVRSLIVGNRLVPDVPPVEIEEWPWPIKVFTLGRFGLIRGGEPIPSTGKARQKPLQLLKALIALGGRGVLEQQLIDILWPDADGDLAHQSLATTLRRLRQHLGNEKAILLRESRLTLNNRYCWVDAWAFERLLGQAESCWKERTGEDRSLRLVERAIALYQGSFLPEETFCTRIVSLRERLRGRFLRCMEAAGKVCEDSGDLSRAVRFYRKGLEVDELAEEFYQHLISCYVKSGMNAEAVRVYLRCRETLGSVLGAKPSHITEKLAKSIQGTR